MDIESRRAFLDTIAQFARAGKTIVLTTHYLEEADQLAERIVVIDRGVVIADATPGAIKAQVAAKRIAFRTTTTLSADHLAGLPITHAEIDEGRVRLLSGEPEAVLRALFARGFDITELEVVGADLEEAFVTLTGRGAARMASDAPAAGGAVVAAAAGAAERRG
jgi:ABC-2 type transport system ATP-binding protein